MKSSVRNYIMDLGQRIGQDVTIAGWIDTVRDQGKLIFFEVRDRSGKIQAVIPSSNSSFELAKEIRNEWVVEVAGKVSKRPEKMVKTDAENGDIEIEIKEIKVLSKSQDLPFEL